MVSILFTLYLQLMTIKNIIFDFGGVLFNIDYKLTERAFSKLLDKPFSFKGFPGLSRALNQYETGKINTETFIWKIQKRCSDNVQGRDVMNAWNSMLLSIPRARLDFLAELRTNYKIYLLSNINEMHADFADRYIEKNYGMEGWQTQCFDKVYYSHIINNRKPNKSIYNYVIEDANINPKESIFIDDLAENIIAARATGLNAARHNPSDEIIDKLESYLSATT